MNFPKMAAWFRNGTTVSVFAMIFCVFLYVNMFAFQIDPGMIDQHKEEAATQGTVTFASWGMLVTFFTMLSCALMEICVTSMQPLNEPGDEGRTKAMRTQSLALSYLFLFSTAGLLMGGIGVVGTRPMAVGFALAM